MSHPDAPKQLLLLVTDLGAAIEEQPERRDELSRHMLPHFERIKKLGDKAGPEITEARALFTSIMGEQWKPKGDSLTVKALRARGIYS